MKQYETPKVKLFRLDCEDIITQSVGQLDSKSEFDVVIGDIFGDD